MVEYFCEKCGRKFTIKDSWRKHINRKFPCVPHQMKTGIEQLEVKISEQEIEIANLKIEIDKLKHIIFGNNEFY